MASNSSNQPVKNRDNKRPAPQTDGHCRCQCGNCRSSAHCRNVAAGCAMRG